MVPYTDGDRVRLSDVTTKKTDTRFHVLKKSKQKTPLQMNNGYASRLTGHSADSI